MIKVSKADARRAMVKYHFSPRETAEQVFAHLKSIQFDPIAPVGCNHDLVLQARVKGYKIGDWQKLAYEDRLIYDGWDKQASLVPFAGWPVRRIFHTWHGKGFRRVFDDHPEAVAAILKELEERGPLMPKECNFQMRKEEWKDSWHGPNLSKQTLRALWHSGKVMTTGRRGGHHIYDLTERVVPAEIFRTPMVDEEEAVRLLTRDRHRAVGLLRPNASQEVWSFHVYADARKAAMRRLVESEEIVEVDVDGVKAHASPEFLATLDSAPLEPRVVFVAPLDQFMWDRKMVAHLFGFDYVWEIYVPEAKRKWGYYVLPVLYGDELVARVEFFCRVGVLEVRRWHFEAAAVEPAFFLKLEEALGEFMHYCSAKTIRVEPGVDPRVKAACKAVSKASPRK